MKCQFCGREIDKPKHSTFMFGWNYQICPTCNDAIEKTHSMSSQTKKEGYRYFSSLREAGCLHPAVDAIAKCLTGEKLSTEEMEAAKRGPDSPADVTAAATAPAPFDNANQEPRRENLPAADSGSGAGSALTTAGVVFWILAVILYVISVNNSYGVANIQATVFAGAAFVSGVVCFASRLVGKILGK